MSDDNSTVKDSIDYLKNELELIKNKPMTYTFEGTFRGKVETITLDYSKSRNKAKKELTKMIKSLESQTEP